MEKEGESFYYAINASPRDYPGVYRYDTADRNVTRVLDLGQTDSEADFDTYKLWDLEIVGSTLYFLVDLETHNDFGQYIDSVTQQIRKVELSELPKHVSETELVKEGGISGDSFGSNIAVRAGGIFYVGGWGSAPIRSVPIRGDFVRKIAVADGTDVPLLGGGDHTLMPDDAMAITLDNYVPIALNRCGDLVVADGGGRVIYLKPKDSERVHAIYRALPRRSDEDTPMAPAALIFDSDDNLYAIMCSYAPNVEPCNVVKMTPIE